MSIFKNQDRLAGIIFFAAALYLYDHAGIFPPESATFPRLILVVTMVLSVVVVARSVFVASWREKDFQPFFVNFKNFAITVSSMGLYILAVEWIGYYTASVLYIPLAAWILGYRSKIVLVSAMVIYLGFAFLVFDQLFELQFPQEFFLRN
jgi:putative tricarboxylic transport membrane protein